LVGIVTTQLPQSAGSSTVFATELLSCVTAYISPAHPITFPGAEFPPRS
jgi:hypothetical protein